MKIMRITKDLVPDFRKKLFKAGIDYWHIYPDVHGLGEQMKWQYKNNDAVHNRKIRTVLEKEQNYFCAYTEDRLSATYARDTEHFNPTLKYTDRDTYRNWFAVSTKFNKEKSTKWADYQPIMHPTDINFDKRLWYRIRKNLGHSARNALSFPFG